MEDLFKQTVQQMTAKEIIMAMVNGLEKEHVKVNMDTYGGFRNGVCYGCAATNAICEIAGVTFDDPQILSTDGRARFISTDYDFIDNFECAINHLRSGYIEDYNEMAKYIGIAEIDSHGMNMALPELETHNYKENLHHYIRLAELQ